MSIRPQPLALAGALAMTIIAGSLSIPAASANDRVVVVQPGQPLSQIAAEHGTTVARLVRLNDLADPNRIYVGQRLQLRPPARTVERRARPITHRVGYGETLTGIAARYRTTVETLVRRNHISDASRIYVGQLLRIPDARSRSGRQARSQRDLAPAFHNHIVRLGETLSGVAMR